MLDAEMGMHLASEEEQAAGKHRNGHSDKRVLANSGAILQSIQWGRHGRFDPKLFEKYKRRFPEFDDEIIAMHARGISTRDIRAHILEIYGLSISPELVSAVTDAVHDEVSAWQSRPLETTSAIVFFDALRVKICDEGTVRNKAVYLAIDMRCSGHNEILGLRIDQTEGAKFRLRMMFELKARGTQDVLIAVVDSLKGFPEAIESVFPATKIQTCIVHLIRNSMQFASWKERKFVARTLRPIYRVAKTEQAARRLEEFDAGELGAKNARPFPPPGNANGSR